MTSPASTVFKSRVGLANGADAIELVRRNGSKIAAWTLPFVLIIYLGLKGGGYDAIVRSEVGVAIWWVVLLGAAIGGIPARAISRTGWIGLGLLFGFALWTGLGTAWSSDAEASVTEFARVMTYLGVFTLVLTA